MEQGWSKGGTRVEQEGGSKVEEAGFQVEGGKSIDARAWRYNICMTSVKASMGKFGQLLISIFSKGRKELCRHFIKRFFTPFTKILSDDHYKLILINYICLHVKIPVLK